MAAWRNQPWVSVVVTPSKRWVAWRGWSPIEADHDGNTQDRAIGRLSGRQDCCTRLHGTCARPVAITNSRSALRAISQRNAQSVATIG
jgi:hypothetical protein